MAMKTIYRKVKNYKKMKRTKTTETQNQTQRQQQISEVSARRTLLWWKWDTEGNLLVKQNMRQ